MSTSIEDKLTRIQGTDNDVELSNVMRDIEAQLDVEHAPWAHYEAARNAAKQRMLYFGRRMIA